VSTTRQLDGSKCRRPRGVLLALDTTCLKPDETAARIEAHIGAIWDSLKPATQAHRQRKFPMLGYGLPAAFTAMAAAQNSVVLAAGQAW
jgi:hypothetical protein